MVFGSTIFFLLLPDLLDTWMIISGALPLLYFVLLCVYFSVYVFHIVLHELGHYVLCLFVPAVDEI